MKLFKLISDSCGKLMVKLGILFLQFCHSDSIEPHFFFTKIVRPLVKYWRSHLIKIACFLDNGLSAAESFSEAICNSQSVQETLRKSGFIVNCEKSVWEPEEIITWLGITLDLRAKMFHISNTRIESILKTLKNLTSTPYVTARKVAKIIGKIVSTILVLRNIVR